MKDDIELILPDDCTMIHSTQDDEVFAFLSKNKISATRDTRFWNQTIWRFDNPSDRTLFLLKWVK